MLNNASKEKMVEMETTTTTAQKQRRSSLFRKETLTEQQRESVLITNQTFETAKAAYDNKLNTNFFSLSEIKRKLNKFLFPGVPSSYPLHKKLALMKEKSVWGALWDVFQIILSLLACFLYVWSTYHFDYDSVNTIYTIEVILISLFIVDYVFNYITANSFLQFHTNIYNIVDLLTILPFFLSGAGNLTILRGFKAMRLLRVIKTTRMLTGIKGVTREIFEMVITIVTVLFLSAGIIHLLENYTKMEDYKCHDHVEYQGVVIPWCDNVGPVNGDGLGDNNTDDWCDCSRNNCQMAYTVGDKEGSPSVVVCSVWPFFDCIYFIVITMTTVGYGDYSPTTVYSKLVIIILVVVLVTIVPQKMSEIARLLSLGNRFRIAYTPTFFESHVVIAGHVNNRRKLESFLDQFYSTARAMSSTTEINVVVVTEDPPSDDLKELLINFEGKLMYIHGSITDPEDLQMAAIPVASGVFLLNDMQSSRPIQLEGDMRNILRILSIRNNAPNVDIICQLACGDNAAVVQDVGVTVVFCVDELSCRMLAKNALCPGFSTFITNLITMTNDTDLDVDNEIPPWLEEYEHGLGQELYYVPYSKACMESFFYDWQLLVEAVSIRYEVLLLGVCNEKAPKRQVCINPLREQIRSSGLTEIEFYECHNICLVIASDKEMVNNLRNGWVEPMEIKEMMKSCIRDEINNPVRIETDTPSNWEGTKYEHKIEKFNSMGLSHTENMENDYVASLDSEFVNNDYNNKEISDDDGNNDNDISQLDSPSSPAPISSRTYDSDEEITHEVRSDVTSLAASLYEKRVKSDKNDRSKNNTNEGEISNNKKFKMAATAIKNAAVVQGGLHSRWYHAVEEPLHLTEAMTLAVESDTIFNNKYQSAFRSSVANEEDETFRATVIAFITKHLIMKRYIRLLAREKKFDLHEELKRMDQKDDNFVAPSMIPPVAAQKKKSERFDHTRHSVVVNDDTKSNNTNTNYADNNIINNDNITLEFNNVSKNTHNIEINDAKLDLEASMSTVPSNPNPVSHAISPTDLDLPVSLETKEIVGQKASLSERVAIVVKQLGKDYENLCNLKLEGHVVIYGCSKLTNLQIFVNELHKPLQKELCNRSLLFIGTFDPIELSRLEKLSNVYFLVTTGDIKIDCEIANLSEAISLSILGNHGLNFDTMHAAQITEDHQTACDDSDTLFIYLQMRDHLSDDANVCLQIIDVGNTSVFNSNFSKDAIDEYYGKKPAIFLTGNEEDEGHIMRGKGIYSAYGHDSTKSMERHHFYDLQDYILNTAAMYVRGSEDFLYSFWLYLSGQKKDPLITPTYLLPVYASGRVTVPCMFDPFMVFAFYNIMIPMTIDRLLCGDDVQDSFSFKVPSFFVGIDDKTKQPKTWKLLRRYFISRSILALGLYRSPDEESFTVESRSNRYNGVLNYMVISPKNDVIIKESDRVFVFCDPYRLAAVLHSLKIENY